MRKGESHHSAEKQHGAEQLVLLVTVPLFSFLSRNLPFGVWSPTMAQLLLLEYLPETFPLDVFIDKNGKERSY